MTACSRLVPRIECEFVVVAAGWLGVVGSVDWCLSVAGCMIALLSSAVVVVGTGFAVGSPHLTVWY